MAAGDLLDGFCDSTYIQGSKGLRSDYFIDNLHSPLDFLYLSKVMIHLNGDHNFDEADDVRFLQAMILTVNQVTFQRSVTSIFSLLFDERGLMALLFWTLERIKISRRVAW